MEGEAASASDIRTQVLQTTLHEISQDQQHNGDDRESHPICCVICLDAVTEPCIAQPCSHRNFDFLCLVSWLEESPTCPLCKVDVKNIRYGNYKEDPSHWQTFAVEPKPRSLVTTSSQRVQASLPARPRRHRRVSSPQISAQDEALIRRRYVHTHGLYSRHVGSNRHQKPPYREITPQLIASDPTMASRARKWIRRELRVFEFLSTSLGPLHIGTGSTVKAGARPRRVGNNAEFLLEYVVAILKTVDVRGAHGQAEDMLSEFLGRDSARLFLHELCAWLRSPFESLEEWDRVVQYDESKVRSDGRRDDVSIRGREGKG